MVSVIFSHVTQYGSLGVSPLYNLQVLIEVVRDASYDGSSQVQVEDGESTKTQLSQELESLRDRMVELRQTEPGQL